MTESNEAHFTETTKVHTNPGNPSDPHIGRELLTVTFWLGGERIDNFNETFATTADDAKRSAMECAKMFGSLTEADVKHYDEFVKELD